ncbi:MAG: helix-turn-helix domain-containing protein [Clostridia bacterium]|nr:helix-turn-helix domain-containing protein [Clostridia bacterium]
MKKFYLNIELINKEIQAQGLSETTLAEKMGIPKRRLHGYLSGYKFSRIPFQIYYGLAAVLKVSFSELITETLPIEKR